MAEFEIAYEPLRQFEGSYSNNKADRGGETFCGIARNFFPGWPGWRIIDDKKKIAGGDLSQMKKALEKTNIQNLVDEWYKAEWWDRLGLERLPQKLANEIFEQAVNLGKGGAGKNVQIICNAHNWSKGKTLFPDLALDGAIGPKTLSALALVIQSGKAQAESLVHALNCMQGAHYLNLAARKPGQRVFTVGWMKRTHCETAKE